MASPINPLPLPSNDRLVQIRDRQKYPGKDDKDPKEGFITQRWQEYLDRQASGLSQATSAVNEAEALDQSASIAAVDMSGSALAGGIYEFVWFVSIRTAAGVSSSVIVTLDFIYRAVTKAISYATVNGNTTGTIGHGGGIIVIDNASPVRYSTTYASNPGGAMHYDFTAVLRRVNA